MRKSKNARLVIVDAVIKEKGITFGCLYAPNSDSPEFFVDAFDDKTSYKIWDGNDILCVLWDM